MGLKKWLKGATRIRFDDRTLGNLLKNGAVAGGTMVGGPLGLAIGGVGSAAGQKALGGTWGESLNAGLKGAGTTGGLQAAKGVLSNAIHSGAGALPGAPAGVDAGANALPSAANDAVSHGGLSLPDVPNLVTNAAPPVDPRGFLSKALDTGGNVAEWAGKHDKTTSALLGAAGDALDPTEERLQRAQAAALERQTGEAEYDYNQRKARDLAMEPLRQALYGKLGQQFTTPSTVAPNPYLTTGGR